MSDRFRWPVAGATALGLALALWAIGRVGFGELVAAAARIGVAGFLLLCLYTLLILAVLGGAALAAMAGESPRRLPLFFWSRTVRDSANELLPFSQVGALALGARTLVNAGLAAPRVYAALVVDLTMEMGSQALFTVLALLAAGELSRSQGFGRPAAWLGVGACLAIAGLFALFQRPALRIATGLAERLLPKARDSLAAFERSLAACYAARRRVTASFLLNLIAWFLAGAFPWLVLRCMDVPAPLEKAVGLESLILALRAAAFVVPAALGVQEAGYVLLAPLFAIDPRLGLAISLTKRARDVAIGLPALLLMQAWEVRASPGRVTLGAKQAGEDPG